MTIYCKCGKRVKLKKDGTPVRHTRWMSSKLLCQYSGKALDA